MDIKFYGVRGSSPFYTPENAQVGCNTSCITITTGDELLIFDAGTGIITLSKSLRKNQYIHGHLFMSHYHMDHIQGIPFFGPFYDRRNTFHLYGMSYEDLGVKDILAGSMKPPYFPITWDELKASFTYTDLISEDIQTIRINEEITVDYIYLEHQGGSLAYKVKAEGYSICYMTDLDIRDENTDALIDFMKDAHLVIIDAHFLGADYQKGWGHSKWEDVRKLSEKAGVKNLGLYHHNIYANDAELHQQLTQLNSKQMTIFIAREGMHLNMEDLHETKI